MKILADIVAVAGAILGSTLIALNLGYNQLGYVFFLLSSIATLYLLSLAKASKSLYIVNGFFLVINMIGVVRY